MKRLWYVPITSILLALLITGCSSVNKVTVNFITPGNDGIAITPGSKIMIVTSGNENICNVIKPVLVAEFEAVAQKNVENAVSLAKKQGKDVQEARARTEAEQIHIVNAYPDYWLFIAVNNEYRKDPSSISEFNRSSQRTKIEDKRGGREVIVMSNPRLTGSAGATINISLYSVHGLVPIHSFGIQVYDSEITENTLRHEDQYLTLFAGECVNRIKDGFLTMERSMTVLIPPNADSNLVSALESQNIEKMQEAATTLKLQAPTDFLKEMNALEEKHDPDLFEEEDMIKKMANHYVYIIDFESQNLDTRSLRLAQRCYFAMLKHTQDEFLAEACANSLARVEKKLELLESVKQ